MRECIRCGEVRPDEEFYRHPGMASGRLNKCKTCCKAQARGYWATQGDPARRMVRALARDGRLNREERRARSQVMNDRRVKLWQQENPGRWKAIQRRGATRRRARKLGAAGSTSLIQILARWDYYGGRCWMCGDLATETDHVIPLSKGGTDWPANQRPACTPCNRRKSGNDHRAFLAA